MSITTLTPLWYPNVNYVWPFYQIKKIFPFINTVLLRTAQNCAGQHNFYTKKRVFKAKILPEL